MSNQIWVHPRCESHENLCLRWLSRAPAGAPLDGAVFNLLAASGTSSSGGTISSFRIKYSRFPRENPFTKSLQDGTGPDQRSEAEWHRGPRYRGGDAIRSAKINKRKQEAISKKAGVLGTWKEFATTNTKKIPT